MKIKRKVIGYKEINTGKVDITDPCYDKDVWCRINGVNLQKGEYRLSAWYGAKLDEDDIDELSEDNGHTATEEEIRAEEKRIQNTIYSLEIQKKHRSFDFGSARWEEVGTIGVDAGLAGIFWNKPDFNDDEWDDFCNKIDSNGKTKPIVDKYGFYSETADGDGEYCVDAIKENGENIALRIMF